MVSRGLGCLIVATCGTLLPSIARAERLLTRTYSIEAGLAHNHVSRIRLDSQGLLWFCTDGGLSKWNEYQFQTYTTEDGLPHAHVDDLLETSRGDYWIATDAGVVHFRPENQAHFFSTYLPGSSSLSRSVNVLIEDNDGSVLLGTGDGLYRLLQDSSGVRIVRVDVPLEAGRRDGTLVNALLRTRQGELWIGTGSGLYILGLSGTWTHLPGVPGSHEGFVNQLREDSRGSVWAGMRGGGLVELQRNSQSGQTDVAHLFTRTNGLPTVCRASTRVGADRRITGA